MPSIEKARLTFLFWNVNRRDRQELICELVAEQDADVVVIAENGQDSNEAMLDLLRQEVDRSFFEPESRIHRLQLFARDPAIDLQE